jgi:hypothetical protein
MFSAPSDRVHDQYLCISVRRADLPRLVEGSKQAQPSFQISSLILVIASDQFRPHPKLQREPLKTLMVDATGRVKAKSRHSPIIAAAGSERAAVLHPDGQHTPSVGASHLRD